MDLSIIITIILSILIFIILNIKIRKNLIWNFLLSLGLSPFVHLLFMVIWIFLFGGDGFFKLDPGPLSALLVIMLYFAFLWYIYIPALGLVILSINRTEKKKLLSQSIDKP